VEPIRLDCRRRVGCALEDTVPPQVEMVASDALARLSKPSRVRGLMSSMSIGILGFRAYTHVVIVSTYVALCIHANSCERSAPAQD
jgi:hypothetical protein